MTVLYVSITNISMTGLQGHPVQQGHRISSPGQTKISDGFNVIISGLETPVAMGLDKHGKLQHSNFVHVSSSLCYIHQSALPEISSNGWHFILHSYSCLSFQTCYHYNQYGPIGLFVHLYNHL